MTATNVADAGLRPPAGVRLDRDALRRELMEAIGEGDLVAGLDQTHPHLFSGAAVFLSDEDLARMRDVVTAVETVIGLPAYRQAVMARAPAVAQVDPGPVGAFMGYDFHLASDGPRLIEVNTNAGGAFLNASLLRAHQAGCPETVAPFGLDFEDAVVRMFRAEWALQRGDGGPRRIAIVDDDPRRQYLYPEFLAARRLFERAGIEAVVADAAELVYENGRLLADGRPVDLVYNRLVDFSLVRPEHAALRSAYADGAVVVTPNPHIHALMADKRDLVPLSDAETLMRWGAPPATAAVLAAAVPRTVPVVPENADELWAKRKALFFKPACGHGSKAAYRGDKLTRGTWADILQGGFVAQAFVPPGERTVAVDGLPVPLKFDVRLYTYAGIPLLAAARLYQGQTTNFRTPGGGFAPVFRDRGAGVPTYATPCARNHSSIRRQPSLAASGR